MDEDTTLSQALRMFWADDWTPAETLLEQQMIATRPEHGRWRAAAYYAEIATMRAVLSELPEDMNAMRDRIRLGLALIRHRPEEDSLTKRMKGLFKDGAQAAAEAALDVETQRYALVDGLLAEANCLLMEGIGGFRTAAYVKGAYKIRQAWKIYERCHTMLAQDLGEPAAAPAPATASATGAAAPKDADDVDKAEAEAEAAVEAEVAAELAKEEAEEKVAEAPADAASADPSAGGGKPDDAAGKAPDLFRQLVAGADRLAGPEVPRRAGCSRADVLSELRLIVGAFHYIMSLAPTGVQWLVKLLGFEANGERGLAELMHCAREPGFRSTHAAVFLVMIHTFITEDDDAAKAFLDKLLEEYPRGSIISNVTGYVLRKQGRMEEAIARFRNSMEAAPVPQARLNASREVARCYLGTERYDDVIPLLEGFLAQTTARMWRPWTLYQLAVAHASCGRQAEAGRALAAIQQEEIMPRQAFGIYAKRRSDEYIKREKKAKKGSEEDAMPFPELVWAQCYFLRDCGQFERTYQLATEALKRLDDAPKEFGGKKKLEWAALLKFSQGAGLRDMKRYDEASVPLIEVANMASSLKQEFFVVAWALYEAAESGLRRSPPDVNRADLYINTTRKLPWKEYDFDRMVSSRIKKTQQTIKKLRAAAAAGPR